MTRSARGRRDENGDSTRAAVPQRTDDVTNGSMNGDEPRGGMSRLWHAFLYDRSVRARVAVLVLIPLLGALGLGSFLFWNAAQDAASARAVEHNAEVAGTALEVVAALQDERDLSGLFEQGVAQETNVAQARERTDERVAKLNELMAGMPEDDGTLLGEAVRSSRLQLDLLDSYREGRDIELEPFDPAGVAKYEDVIESLLRFVKATGVGVDDSDLLSDIDALDALARATNTASVERGLISHAIALANEGETAMSASDLREEQILQGEQDFLLSRFVETAAPDFRALYYERMPAVRDSAEMEGEGDRDAGVVSLRNTAMTSQEMPNITQQWYNASTARIDVMRDLQTSGAQAILNKAADAARGAQLTAVLTALAVVVVLALTIVLAYAVARSIIRPLRRLRSAALYAADSGLPALVSRIQEDGPAVVRQVGQAVTPEGRDEIGQVASAFNDVHSTAVRVAGEQALLRQNLDTIVVNLSRRTQGLVDRQLGEIEDLESRERDPDQLGTLFRIDHLATRVRRHAESLLVLAGVEEMRRQGSAAPVLDVVRTAVGEVEQYPRIKFGVMPTDLIVPAAVDDVAHLLAELLDNATEFSAPSTAVHVTSQPLLGGGLRLQVTDTGLGIPQDQLSALNERLRDPGDIDVAASRTLGIYVVARLAARHGITVRLIPAEGTTGTIAQVDLPSHLVVSPLDTTDGVLQALQPSDSNRGDQSGQASPQGGPTGLFGTGRAADMGQQDQQDQGQPKPAQPPLPSRPQPGQPQPAPAQRQQAQSQPGAVSAPPQSPAGSRPAPGQSTPHRDAPRQDAPHQPPSPPVPPTAPAGPQEPRQPAPVARDDQSGTGRPGGFGPESGRHHGPSQPSQGQQHGEQRPIQPQPERQPERRPAAPQPVQARNAASAYDQQYSSGGPPTARSLRGSEPQLPQGDSPIYDAVRSAWFSKGGGGNLDWTSPGDEGWRRAAAALRTAEDAANARRGQAPAPQHRPPQHPAPQRTAPQRPQRPNPWTSGGIPGPAAQPPRSQQPVSRPAPGPAQAPSQPPAPAQRQGEQQRPAAQPQQPAPPPAAPRPQAPQQPAPVASAQSQRPESGASGLPVRQRGATLVPGSIAGAAGQDRPQQPAPPKDAGNVASTLSNLQRGVSRGREESGGWVPKRPSDSERSS
ncbi:MAG TPA: nitrate- and nitrite sensing domain-containing protein [Jiangellaceae bacterium]